MSTRSSDARLETRRASARFAATLAAVAGLAIALHLTGTGSRRILDGHRVEQVGSGAEALAAWLRAGVRGRVLLWFDRSLPTATVPDATAQAFLRDPSAPVEGAEESFVYLAMRANVVRSVVFVVPDERWEAFAGEASASSDLRPLGAGFVRVIEGTPIICLAARDLDFVVDGPPLIYTSGRTREFFGDALAERLLETGYGSDLVLLRR
jgi:hypothetical protein